jgi:hypothetical protein
MEKSNFLLGLMRITWMQGISFSRQWATPSPAKDAPMITMNGVSTMLVNGLIVENLNYM